MRRIILSAALVVCGVLCCQARPAFGPDLGDESEDASAGFDCPGGALNPNRPEVKIDAGDVTKKARVLPRPAYTREARAARVSGVVRAEVVIEAHSGKVAWAKVDNGPALLREAVKSVVCRAQFYITIVDGPPLRVGGFISYRFGRH